MTTTPTGRTKRRQFIEATHASVVFAGVLLAVGGWAGLVWLVVNRYPTVINRWMFFALLHVALTGTALPFVRYLNKRFARPEAPPAPPGVLMRQATWVGIFGALCIWLRISRLLSWPMAIGLVMAVTAIEVLIRLRESAQLRAEQRRGSR